MVTEIPLTRGLVALVDDVDAPRILEHKWHASEVAPGRFYARRSNGQYMHQFLTGYARTDHINGSGLDNRRENLRPATHGQNMQNTPPRRDNTSGYKGVTFHRRAGRWMAYIDANRRRQYLGYYDTAEAAARARDHAALTLHGEYARLNLPVEESE